MSKQDDELRDKIRTSLMYNSGLPTKELDASSYTVLLNDNGLELAVGWIETYISIHYIAKAELLRAIEPPMPDFTRLETNDYTKGQYEGWRVCREQIKQALGLTNKEK